ncbi:MAG TPA: LOG family protein [Acidimicrobiales bacterium]
MSNLSRDRQPSLRLASVIGSARVSESDPRWGEAFELGRRLALADWSVVTGGYSGLMVAAAAGAKSVGGTTLGLPMTAWDHLSPNAHNDELRWCDDYGTRLQHLLTTDAVIALDGGVGTLSEMAVVWAAAQTEPNAPRLFLVGEMWHSLHGALTRELLMAPADALLPQLVMSVEEVVELLSRDRPLTPPSGAVG